jgi:hypothetical protein
VVLMICPSGIGMKKQDVGMNLRSHSLDKLRQIVRPAHHAHMRLPFLCDR